MEVLMIIFYTLDEDGHINWKTIPYSVKIRKLEKKGMPHD